MRRIQHLHKNRFGIYCFRYVFPKSFIASRSNFPKSIHISLKTRDKSYAIKQVQYLWLGVQKLGCEAIIKNEALGASFRVFGGVVLCYFACQVIGITKVKSLFSRLLGGVGRGVTRFISRGIVLSNTASPEDSMIS